MRIIATIATIAIIAIIAIIAVIAVIAAAAAAQLQRGGLCEAHKIRRGVPCCTMKPLNKWRPRAKANENYTRIGGEKNENP